MTDPFDVIWVDSDPLGRSVKLQKSIVADREIAGKHDGAEYLHNEDIKRIITDPERIDLTETNPSHREIYYMTDDNEEYKHARAVVQFNDDSNGTVISWSRYKKHVSCINVVYERPSEEL